ncbi:hypothetical protein RB653_006926 [Dictyostelium firmibasis]|uniref:IPT/TIG domain-containing protein n=1 Tax=Dictyostelium firmibasis TaxID=79012 RepID=A0AAN7TL00_9MYCE
MIHQLDEINNSTKNQTHYYSTDGGNEITITGKNFIPKELFGYIQQCKPLASIGFNHKVIIKVGSQDSNETVYFSYEKPILELKNYTGTTNGKTEITITGINFISKELIANYQFKQSKNYIIIGDNHCNETIWINSTPAKCKPIPGTGSDYIIIISVGNQNSSQLVYFSYHKPILDIKIIVV